MLLLELHGAQITQCGVQAASVIDLFDEARQFGCYIGEGLKLHWVHSFDLERLHEALSLGVVVGIATPAHRTDDPVLDQHLPIRLDSVLTAAVRVVGQSRCRPTPLERRSQSRKGQVGVDRPDERVANHAARPGIQNDRDVDEAADHGDVGQIRDPELVGPIRHDVPGQVREDRALVVTVGGRDVAAANTRLQVMRAHEAADLLVV